MPNTRREIYIRLMRFEEARNKLLAEIEKAFLDGVKEIEVIHGIGSYTLHDMVLEECKRIAYLKPISATFHPNPGSTLFEVLSPEPHEMSAYIERS